MRTAIWGAIILGVTLSCAPRWKVSPPQEPPLATLADSGMIVAAHPLAAEAGLEVLREGGNAVDAALAALFVLNVVEPHASGLGGGGFALVWFQEEDPKVVIYREKAPYRIDVARYYDPNDSLKSLRRGATSVCVPGAPAGWAELHRRWGSQPLDKLIQPAIRWAEEGFVVDRFLAERIQENISLLQTDTLLSQTFLKEGLPLALGDTLRQPHLGATMRKLATEGLESFYYGEIAWEVVGAVKTRGGALDEDDLSSYSVQVVSPLKASWGEFTLYTVPPPSMGGLAMVESFQLAQLAIEQWGYTDKRERKWGIEDPSIIHLLAQSIAQGMADAYGVVEDPLFGSYPYHNLLDPARLRKVALTISRRGKVKPRSPIIEPQPTSSLGNTTHLVVIDQWGNAVSLTQSINYFFGSGVTAGRTGIILNNQMADFSAPPEKINLLAPGKVPRSYMAPTIVARAGKPFLVLGTPGGSRIPSTMAQILFNRLVMGMDISSTVDANRLYPSGEHLVLENRLPISTLKRLKRYGYHLHLAPPFHFYFGGAHTIEVAGDHLIGAADRRRLGASKGY